MFQILEVRKIMLKFVALCSAASVYDLNGVYIIVAWLRNFKTYCVTQTFMFCHDVYLFFWSGSNTMLKLNLFSVADVISFVTADSFIPLESGSVSCDTIFSIRIFTRIGTN